MTEDALRCPWILGGVTFQEGAIAEIDADARRGLAEGEECCGIVSGPEAHPLLANRVTRFENRANKLHALDPETFPRTGREYFDINPLAFARAIDRGALAGEPVKVLYHSHIDCGAYFSETDAAAATGNSETPIHLLAYLVVSIREGGVIDDRRLFVWSEEGRQFVESEFSVVP